MHSSQKRRSRPTTSPEAPSSRSASLYRLYPTPKEVEAIVLPDDMPVLDDYRVAEVDEPSPLPTSHTSTVNTSLSHSISPPFSDEPPISLPQNARHPSAGEQQPPPIPSNHRGGLHGSRHHPFHLQPQKPPPGHEVAPTTTTQSPVEPPPPQLGAKEKDSKSKTELGAQSVLEVSPGQYLKLHGTEETLEALRQLSMRATECPMCLTKVYVIDVAAYLLCPLCRVVSPTPNHDKVEGKGVGVAITPDKYFQWYQDHEADVRPNGW